MMRRAVVNIVARWIQKRPIPKGSPQTALLVPCSRNDPICYDSVDNRIGMVNALAGKTLAAGDTSHDADNKLLQAGIQVFAYDDDGQLRSEKVSGAATTSQHKADGTLASVLLSNGKRITYLHDSLGRRIARAVDGARTHAAAREWLYATGRA